MASDYPFDIFKHFAIVLSILLLFMTSDYPFDIFKHFAIVLSILRQYNSKMFEDIEGVIRIEEGGTIQ
jgi:hypothetical protein